MVNTILMSHKLQKLSNVYMYPKCNSERHISWTCTPVEKRSVSKKIDIQTIRQGLTLEMSGTYAFQNYN